NYGVFDEKRWFTPGNGTKIVTWRGHRLGILVCEDMWSQGFDARLKQQKAELIIVINASPFEQGKMAHRRRIAAAAAKQAGAPLIYVNLVGGQDDIVFDGGSFALDAKGKLKAPLPEFFTEMSIIDITNKTISAIAKPVSVIKGPVSREEILWRAMAVGLADYVRKNDCPAVMLGLSGGIDSALALALACDAIGADRVKGVLLPSPYTSEESIEDAHASAEMLGIETMTVPITPGMEMFDEVLSPVFKQSNWMKDVAIGGNVQARLRGMTLMAISNKFGWLLLATSNKSEVAVGYTTLYGDSCGGYAPLKDLYKTQIYAMARWRNSVSSLPIEKGGWGGFPVIPERSISRAPTAELAPGQKDQDQLPPYALLDKILALHIEGRLSAKEIIAKKYPKAVVEKVVKMVRMSEYKRRQSCPGTKLTPMLFGRDRRFPLTNKF
ncbi:MAG: NAD+ synthase, partial [Pseudomonadota bacterium]|nr:NAD+ synthase [Pseudomonadota bacterium]